MTKWLFMVWSGVLIAVNWFVEPWAGWFMFLALTGAYEMGRRFSRGVVSEDDPRLGLDP